MYIFMSTFQNEARRQINDVLKHLKKKVACVFSLINKIVFLLFYIAI